MYSDIKIIKKEVRDFLIINFSLITFISIFIFIRAAKPNSISFLSSFAGLFMYIPAFSAITILNISHHYIFPSSIYRFFNIFSIATITKIILCIIESLFINNLKISFLVDVLVSCYLTTSIFMNSSDFEILNLCFNKNFKKIVFVILISLAITTISNLSQLKYIQISPINILDLIMRVLFIVGLNVVFGCNLFFGEEFGWRYFLQPRLQNLYGKRLGVILLGPIWGIWHLPLCITLYSPESPIYCVITHIIACTTLGVFLGYAYMKTENLWAPMLVHLLNNSIAPIIGNSHGKVYTLKTLFYEILLYSIVFLPFLLIKEYSSNQKLYIDN
ncbi:membrane protein [Paraclostridium benzoelyticum]|uniref:Membrane protein n=1 Tax=Paraclostridium benzoelyticum TaxID=1629550 RepID=A0A0M3DDP7_9FIRM|nr:CPBP family intramembrane glutamic endopeptidase [Paraclostridium benzoelyticum]KKY00246.1 membrane protein [Paraclostridium benzoelyticum]